MRKQSWMLLGVLIGMLLMVPFAKAQTPVTYAYVSPIIQVCEPGEKLTFNYNHRGEVRFICSNGNSHYLSLTIRSNCAPFSLVDYGDGWYQVTCIVAVIE